MDSSVSITYLYWTDYIATRASFAGSKSTARLKSDDILLNFSSEEFCNQSIKWQRKQGQRVKLTVHKAVLSGLDQSNVFNQEVYNACKQFGREAEMIHSKEPEL
jgi:hypothetical protein